MRLPGEQAPGKRLLNIVARYPGITKRQAIQRAGLNMRTGYTPICLLVTQGLIEERWVGEPGHANYKDVGLFVRVRG